MTHSAMRAIESLGEISAGYDALFCDVWGVVHDGVAKHAQAEAALRAAREGGCRVVLLTNSPRPAAGVVAQLDALGVSREAYDAIVTSGDATRAMIAAGSGRIFHIGPERDHDLFAGLDLSFEGEETAETVVATGLFDDLAETPDDYAPLLARLAGRGLPMICANPDIVVHRGERLIYCAGSIAAAYAALGQVVHLAGKPHPPIYAVARSLLEAPQARILCIGDGLFTDVLGANNFGADCLFVSHGIHRDELAAVLMDPVRLSAELVTRGVRARFVLPALR